MRIPSPPDFLMGPYKQVLLWHEWQGCLPVLSLLFFFCIRGFSFPPAISLQNFVTTTKCLLQTLNQMQPARRIDHTRDLTRLQGKGSLLKLLLHVTLAEVTQVAPLTGTAAVGLGDGQVAKGDFAALDALLVALDDLLSLVLATGDVGLDR